MINKSIRVAAAALIKNKRVLLTQRTDREFEGLWEFPGGKIEKDESNFEAIVREMYEELLISVDPLNHFYTSEFDYPTFHLTMEVIHCELISGKITLTEHSAYKWVSLEELDQVDWVPADVAVIEPLKELIKSL